MIDDIERDAIVRECDAATGSCEPVPRASGAAPSPVLGKGGGAGVGRDGYLIVPAASGAGGGVGDDERWSRGADDAGSHRAFLRELLGDLLDVDGREWREHLTRGRKGALESSLGNVFLILRHDRRVCADVPRFNELSLHVEVGTHSVSDTVLTAFRTKIERYWAITPGKEVMEDALRLTGELEGFNPVRRYLDALVWDGVPRIDELASDWFGANPNEPLYARFVACFFLGAVRRILAPGCTHQSVLVLVGDQGMAKSYFLRGLAGPFFNESKIEVGEKDGALKTHAAWIHEFPEVESITLFREAAAVKAFITTSSDTFRAPYERSTRTVPRSSIFAATTNQTDFLRDESGTGSRRWHPIRITRPIDRDLVDATRDQLWAEAMVRARTREASFLDRDEERRREQLAVEFYQLDPWENAIIRWLPTAPEVTFLRGVGRFFVSSSDIFGGALGLRRADPGVGEARRLGGLMRRLGWERKRERVPIGTGPARRLSEPEWGYAAPATWKPVDGAATAAGDDWDHPAPLGA